MTFYQLSSADDCRAPVAEASRDPLSSPRRRCLDCLATIDPWPTPWPRT